MNILDLIMNDKIIQDNPPVLLDVGASGKIHHKWKRIAKYSTCIAFDPDLRDIDEIQNNKTFNKIYFIDSLVSYEKKEQDDFYLTQSPYCSSMLKPLQSEVDKYSFGYLFEIERVIKVNATTLKETLQKIDIKKVDWFKTDSQGIDLKIFKSLPGYDKVITVEFEPGFIDAYENEDKINDVLTFMEKQNFWLSEFSVQGDVRISKDIKEKYFKEYHKNRLTSIIKTNPGWAEMTYMNDFSNINSERDYLLGIAFNYVEENFAYCFELCELALNKFQNKIFKEIIHYLKMEKEKIVDSKQEKLTNPMEFNKNLSKVISKLSYLSTLDEKFILYGAGSGAELIIKYLQNLIEYIVDINHENLKNKFIGTSIYPIDKLATDNKKVIISVFGREAEIIENLRDKYNIDENQIISIF